MYKLQTSYQNMQAVDTQGKKKVKSMWKLYKNFWT